MPRESTRSGSQRPGSRPTRSASPLGPPGPESPVGHLARQSQRLGVALVLALFASAWAATAWVCDDAFITFRTVDNALQGFGLVWNVGERVQAYTHPLWLLLLLAASALHADVYLASLALSALLTAAALALLVARLAASPGSAALAVAALLASRAFVDYSSSGLENPLVHVLLGSLMLVCSRRASDDRTQWLRVALFSLTLVTRLDLLFIAFPLLASAWWRDGLPRLRWLVLGAAPLVAWEAFSLVYYGSWIANSALAKLSAGVPAGERMIQGVHYFAASLRWDPLSIVLLVAGPALAFARGDPMRVAATGAIAAHLLWVASVGGDFMAGRFLTPALFVSAMLVARAPLPRMGAWSAATALVVATLAISYLSPFSLREYGADWHAAIDDRGVADERRFHLESTALRAVLADGGWRSAVERERIGATRDQYYRDPWIAALSSVGVLDEGEAWPPRSVEAAGELTPVLVKGGVGVLGYRMGPEVVVIDYHGLGDPLLARLPALPRDPVLALLIPRLAGLDWRVGHYLRPVPAGYVASRATGVDQIGDPDLAELYRTIRTVVSGPVFSASRAGAILRLHSGWADERIRRYVERAPIYSVYREQPAGSAVE